MSRKRFITLTLAIALFALSVSAIVGYNSPHESDRKLSSASWEEVYWSADEMVNSVDTIVLARAVAVYPGRVVITDGGNDELPFQLVEFETLNGLKGEPDGARFFVERAGGTDSKGVENSFDADGGEFEVGGSYLLFLQRQNEKYYQNEGSYYYQVNDQGRYHVEGETLLAIDHHEKVSAILHGKTVEEAIKMVEQMNGRPWEEWGKPLKIRDK